MTEKELITRSNCQEGRCGPAFGLWWTALANKKELVKLAEGTIDG